MSQDKEFIVNKNWERTHVSCTEPSIVGAYSIDRDRNFQDDFSQLKYFKHNYQYGKTIRINLEEKYKDYVKRPKVEEKLNHLLDWIAKNRQILENRKSPKSEKWLDADFISYRGLLTKIMTTRYEKRDGWIICAAKFQGNIYLCGYETEEEKRRNEQMSEKEKRFCAYGYIFEHFLLSDNPLKNASPEGPVYDAEEFNCVLQSQLGSHKICFGAEMDGIRSDVRVNEKDPLRSGLFVELKTTKEIKNRFQETNFHRKTFKWWCQSFLVGIRDIIVGFRTDYGVINKLISYETRELPEMAKQFDLWNPHVALEFLNEFLTFVKKTVTESHDKCVYKFTRVPGGNIFVDELKGHHKDEFSFLPTWFDIAATAWSH